MVYVPIHQRPPYFANLPTPPGYINRSPRYASPMPSPTSSPPSYDPDATYAPNEADAHSRIYESAPASVAERALPAYQPRQRQPEPEVEAGPSRKRPRSEANGNGNGDAQASYVPRPHPGPSQNLMETPIMPSIFGIAPRNEFTKKIGEFIMECSRDRQNVEIEIKLGTLHSPTGPQRVRFPTRTEIVLQPDYPIGNFASTMDKAINVQLNQLLNHQTGVMAKSPAPIRFKREQQVDSFYGGQRGSKIRVSRDRAGNVIECIRKHRVADLNVHSPNQLFDWRVSVSTEEPVEEIPSGAPTGIRDKDRACYTHQFCRVDLTVVTMQDGNGQPQLSYELEIEFLDVPTLLAEGEKEERGEPNRFDEILQSVLDSARILIRNVG